MTINPAAMTVMPKVRITPLGMDGRRFASSLI